MVYVQANAGVIQQLTVDAVNVSVGSGLVDPIRAVDKGAPVAIARIEMQRPPYALLAKPAIKSIKDLKGKIVSVGGPKDITRIFFERMLARAGVDPKEVDLIYAGATSARLQALQSGAADAALLTAPYNFHAEAAGFTNLGLASEVVDMPFSGVVDQPQLGAQPQGRAAEVPQGLHAVDRLAVRPGQPRRGGRADDGGEQAQPRRRRQGL